MNNHSRLNQNLTMLVQIHMRAKPSESAHRTLRPMQLLPPHGKTRNHTSSNCHRRIVCSSFLTILQLAFESIMPLVVIRSFNPLRLTVCAFATSSCASRQYPLHRVFQAATLWVHSLLMNRPWVAYIITRRGVTHSSTSLTG